MKTIFGIMVLLVLFGGIAFAAGLDETSPVLQIKDYEVVPSNIYPSTTGQLKLTIVNSGDEMATGTTIYYTYKSNEKWTLYVGDIGENSEAITTIPFLVPDSVPTGIILVNLDIYYRDEEGSTTKHSMTTIPLTVSQHKVLEVNTLSVSKDTIRKGEKLTAELEIRNTGGIMRNVEISPMDNSSFSLDGTTMQTVGDIPANSSKNVSVTLISSSSAEEGKYSIPVKITYYDALQNEVTETIYLGPVMVTDSSSLFRISCESLSPSEIGSQLQYEITIENQGNSVQSATLVIGQNDVFTPLGQNTLYFDDLQPGQKVSEVVTLGVDADAASGYYTLPLTLKTNGEELDYTSGIAVQATPSLIFTSETQAGTSGLDATIRIANSGNTIIRSVYVSAEPTDELGISGTSEKFIGTLNVDDFTSFALTLRTKKPADSYTLPVTVTFKDNDNVEHTVTYNVKLASTSSAFAGTTDGTADAQSFRGSRASGINPLLYLGGGALLLGVLFFGYKKWKGNK